MSETEYNESKRREAEMLVPVGQLDGIGAKIEERLAQADIGSVQRLATSQIETLTKIPGIGEKTAEALIDKAKKFVRDLEREYTKRKKAEAKAKAAEKAEEGKLTAADVFEDDTEFVTEVDDVLEATAPDLDDVDDEDESETKIRKDIDD
jgi:NAD-dependent DNA ligase